MLTRILLLLGLLKRCLDCGGVVSRRMWCGALRVCWRCRLNGMCVVNELIDGEE